MFDRVSEIVSLLRRHSVTAWSRGCRVYAIEHYSDRTGWHCRLVDLPASKAHVLSFLGY
jgi:hypothetical protein